MSSSRIYKGVFFACIISIICSAVVLLYTVHASYTVHAEEAALKLNKRSVKMGKQISFQNVRGDETFHSNKPLVAYVNGEGVITGKKAGKAVITVRRGSKKVKSVRIRVTKAKRKPKLAVCLDELHQSEIYLTEQSGQPVFAIDVENLSRKYKIKKLKLSYKVQVLYYSPESPAATAPPRTSATPAATGDAISSTETPMATGTATASGVKLLSGIGRLSSSASAALHPIRKTILRSAESKLKAVSADTLVRAKKSAEATEYIVTFTARDLGKQDMRTLYADVDREVYGGGEIIGYEKNFKMVSARKSFVQDEQGVYTWGYNTKDTKAPVFRGLVKGNSYHNADVYMVMYPDSDWSFKKYVSAWDKRDGKVNFAVDTSHVNKNKKGVYRVWFQAQDSAGNAARTWAKIQVRQLTGVDSYADAILKRITRKSWSDVRKCKAIYSYVKSHMSYVDYDGGNRWESSALRAIRYSNGNCYAYYSLSRLLMTRAGIPNMMITRYPARVHHHHWWNLVYVEKGWYHFDTVSRRRGGRFCLLTEAQIRSYSRVDSYAFQFPSRAYPKRATKVICRGPF